MAGYLSSSEDESSSPSPTSVSLDVPVKRPTRQRRLPPKLREILEDLETDETAMTLEELDHDQSRKIILKCSQNGKLLTAQVKDVSREDGHPLSANDFKPGASLLVEHKGKFYPVQFMRYKDDDVTETRTKDDTADKGRKVSEGKKKNGSKQDTTKKSILLRAKNDKENIRQDRDEGKPPTKKPKIGTQSHHLEDDVYTPLSQGSTVDRGGERSSPGERVHLEELLIRVEKKVENIERRQISMEKRVEKILASVRDQTSAEGKSKTAAISCVSSSPRGVEISDGGGCSKLRMGACSSEESASEGSGTGQNSSTINMMMMRIQSKDAYSYGLTLLHSLFTQEELARSLLFSSKKDNCTKPGLDPIRVEKMLNAMDKRYKDDQWDITTFRDKVNQNCRDAARKLRKQKKVLGDSEEKLEGQMETEH